MRSRREPRHADAGAAPARLVPDGRPRHELRDGRRRDRVRHPRQVPARLVRRLRRADAHSSRRRAGTVTRRTRRRPDAFWATAGGMGLTGVDHRGDAAAATGRDLAHRLSTPNAHATSTTAWRACSTATTSTGTRSRGSTASRPAARLGRSVLTRGNHATLDELAPRDRRDRVGVRAAHAAAARRRGCPNGLINSAERSARSTRLWFRKAPRTERDAIQSMTSSSSRSTACADWNRMYGSRGFVQYQFVVPLRRRSGRPHARSSA